MANGTTRFIQATNTVVNLIYLRSLTPKPPIFLRSYARTSELTRRGWESRLRCGRPACNRRSGTRRMPCLSGLGYSRGMELIFEVHDAEEGAYCARALGHAIFTQAETWEEL